MLPRSTAPLTPRSVVHRILDRSSLALLQPSVFRVSSSRPRRRLAIFVLFSALKLFPGKRSVFFAAHAEAIGCSAQMASVRLRCRFAQLTPPSAHSFRAVTGFKGCCRPQRAGRGKCDGGSDWWAWSHHPYLISMVSASCNSSLAISAGGRSLALFLIGGFLAAYSAVSFVPAKIQPNGLSRWRILRNEILIGILNLAVSALLWAG